MDETLTLETDYTYIDKGEGQAIVILHGLMGGLSNFEGVFDYFPANGYRVIIPELPIYDLPLKETTVKTFAEFIYKFFIIKEVIRCYCVRQLLWGPHWTCFLKNVS